MGKRRILVFIISLLSVLLVMVPSIQANQLFTDVSKNSSHYEGITALTSKNMISGYTLKNGTKEYRPSNEITRTHTAVLLTSAIQLPIPRNVGKVLQNFKDINSNHIYADQIAATYEAGIFRGFQGNFNEGPLSREQMATVLVSAFDLKDSGKEIGIYLGNVSHSHKQNVKILAQHGITNQLNNFRPGENVTRGQFATFLYQTMKTVGLLDADKETPEPQPEEPKDDGELTTSEIVKLNDEKVVLINTNLGQGSGVVVGNGLILTNEHVIRDMSSGTITFTNGTSFEIEGIVVSDEVKDLALIKTKQKPAIGTVNIGTIASLEKGDKLVAIGSPRGLQNTVSEGIVSSFRQIDSTSVIQMTVPIAPGSSGGGLFDTQGNLVGITTSSLRDSTNLNFAVAIDEVKVWNNYLRMNFGQITVKPIGVKPSGSMLPIRGFENIALGMTKSEVKRIENAYLLSEYSDRLSYTGKNVLDFTANVAYEFENNKLVEIYIFHDVVDNRYDLDLLESYFIVMYTELAEVYGDADALDTDWYDDYDSYTLSALWFNDGYDTFLAATVKLDYSSYGGISITSK